ncbi:MAG: hypothetical protein LBF89_00535 [Bacteroidales bacterium]|jgi:hypothetical protein|nr:hypothetical protein [Bacteroidales bacterium]
MKNNFSDLHYNTNVEAKAIRFGECGRPELKIDAVKGLLRGMIGKKAETKHGWNSPLPHSASKKE